VLPKLLFTMRTANRAPKVNYLARTVESLWSGGVRSDQIHLFPTDPDVSWMPDIPGVHVHVPEHRRTPNMNGIAPIALLDRIEADWIVLSEDDLEWCHNPIETMAQWLQYHERPEVSVYRFFGFERQMVKRGPHVAETPLREQKGSQVIALRADDARRCAAWAQAHPKDWRPKSAPFQDQPHNGFDKLIGYWALQDRPSVQVGLVSQPFFVRHLGYESSLHRVGVARDAAFKATPYEVAPCA
jgi:hypothetical protein